MPISNDSQLWPKILTCKKCQAPVNEGGYKQAKVDSYFYFCPNCEVLLPEQNVEWTKQAVAS